MLTSAVLATLLAATSTGVPPTTTNNDDSCEISTAPAATLLVPYFQVETAQRSLDTLFTVINTSHLLQAARVTVWSDWSYPLLTFDLILTGHDVQAVSLYEVIVEGKLPAACATSPVSVPRETAAAIRSALTTGTYQASGFAGCGATSVGSPASTHRTPTAAVGYVTIDVVAGCGSTSPNDPSYIAKELRFDNVLTGDYETVDATPGRNFATGTPLVHIRAVPEGGPSGVPLSPRQTNLPYTFYSRFINDQTVDGTQYSGALMNYDRRQPLPATFAARYIQGGVTSFTTDFKIWREGRTGPVTCTNASSNTAMPFVEIVRFDEHENANTYVCHPCIIVGPPGPPTLPAASQTNTASSTYPVLSSPAGDHGGWMYLNLHNNATTGGVDVGQHPDFGPRASQNWVTITMSTHTGPPYATESDATRLSNGCWRATETSVVNDGPRLIGPGPNQTP